MKKNNHIIDSSIDEKTNIIPWGSLVRFFFTDNYKPSTEIKRKAENVYLNGNATQIFNNYLKYYHFDIHFNKTTEIELCGDNDEFFFIYFLKGSFQYSSDRSNYRTVKSFHPVIFPCIDGRAGYISIDSSESIKMTVIKFTNNEDASIATKQKFDYLETIINQGLHGKAYFMGKSNLNIAEHIKKLHHSELYSASDKYYQEGMIHIILGLFIKQFNLESNTDTVTDVNLSNEDLIQINMLTDHIRQNIDKDLSIDYLSKISGLSAVKLQDGFKTFFGTVNTYIKNERLNKAVYLLTNSDMNISEVVRAIGFTSKSYFSKIFREKYNISPKDFQQKLKK